METKKKTMWSLLNPVTWIEAAFQLLAALFAPLLRWLGMLTPPSTEGFQNIHKGDVDDAAKDAKNAEEAIDEVVKQMSPAEVVKAYARADADTRATMDLLVLDFDEQDWLMRLSTEDLDLLGMSTTVACARSLEARKVQPAYPKPRPESEAPETLTIPSAEDEEEWKRQQVAERFRQVQRELWLSPGVPNMNPSHALVTLH